MNTMKVLIQPVLLSFLLLPAAAYEVDTVARAANKAAADRIYNENRQKHKDSPDALLLPGLLADRKSKQIILQAEATGLTEGSPVEFFLVGESSGHAYESLAVCFALPGDVQKALEFTGLQPGRTADSRTCAFWPKGERVIMTVSSAAMQQPVRIEELVIDSRTRKCLPGYGLVFTGSLKITSADSGKKPGYAVDLREPNAVASTYNALETVMDVPFAWSQKSTYGNVLVNPARPLKSGSLLTVCIEPENKDGRKRVVELGLDIAARPGTAGLKLNELAFHVRNPSGTQLNETADLNSALKLFDSLNEAKQDPFVQLRLADSVTVGAAAEACSLLSKIDSERGIRIEPPAAGQLYYRAFIPNERYRNRADRFAQPWELNLSLTNAAIQAVLSRIDQIWTNGKVEPDLKAVDFPVSSPQEFQQQLRAKGPGSQVIFVFADPAVNHGQLMSFVGPVRDDYPMIHVYVK